VGRACGTHGRGEKRVQGFGVKGRRKEKSPLERQGVTGMIGLGGVDLPGSG
jgi:hypothetical protein